MSIDNSQLNIITDDHADTLAEIITVIAEIKRIRRFLESNRRVKLLQIPLLFREI